MLGISITTSAWLVSASKSGLLALATYANKSFSCSVSGMGVGNCSGRAGLADLAARTADFAVREFWLGVGTSRGLPNRESALLGIGDGFAACSGAL